MGSRSQREEEFNGLLLKIIDETISCLGKPAEKAILHYTEKKFNIPHSDVPSRLEDYAAAMERLLGYGSKTLLKRIMREICTQTQSVVLCPELTNMQFADYIAAVKSSFLQNKDNVVGFTLGIDEKVVASDAGPQVLWRRLT